MNKTFKRFFALFLAVTLTIAAASLPVCAIRGTWDGVKWELLDGTLTVTGDSVPNCTQSEFAPWRKFAGEIFALTLSGVRRIGSYAFAGLSQLKSVEWSDVGDIGAYAFSGCTALASVQIPEGTASVGDFAFAECTALASVSLPSSLASVGEGAFESCPALSRITCSGGRYQNSGAAVIDTERGTIVRYPADAADKSYSAPSGITGVDSGAFRDASNLTAVELTDVTAIGDGAFYGCTSLVRIGFGKTRSIGRAAFYGCASLTEVNFPATLTAVGDNAFTDSATLARASFSGNAPESFGDGVFDGCASTFTVIAASAGEGFGSDGFWHGYPLLRHGLYGGGIDGCELAWSLDTETGLFSVTGTGEIPDFAEAGDAPWYEYRRAITSISLGENVTAVGDNAFRFTSVTAVTFPAGVTSIGKYALSGSTQLKSVSAPGVRTVGQGAFYNDDALLICSLPALSELGAQAFSGAESLKWVIVGETAPTVGEYAFDDADGAEILYSRGGEGFDGIGVPSRSYFAGDADGDGVCTVGDAITVLKVVAEWSGVEYDAFSADTDLDGSVDVGDAINILKCVAGWNIKLGLNMYL